MTAPKRHACAQNAANVHERLGTVAGAGPGTPPWSEQDERREGGAMGKITLSQACSHDGGDGWVVWRCVG